MQNISAYNGTDNNGTDMMCYASCPASFQPIKPPGWDAKSKCTRRCMKHVDTVYLLFLLGAPICARDGESLNLNNNHLNSICCSFIHLSPVLVYEYDRARVGVVRCQYYLHQQH